MINTIALWLVAGLHLMQVMVSLYNQQFPVAVMMLGFVIADLGIILVAVR